jgi:predicted O-linked N-acetylglucosamine transferase (SPINDLY family)
LEHESARTRIAAAFAERDIDLARLDLLAQTKDYAEHLALYGEIDIALDTFPYNGTATTCEALWMGVPVIALAGQTHVSRVGVSLLQACGLGEFIAESPQAYVDIAASLASDHERLQSLHDTLRQRMRASPLMDAVAYTRDLENVFQRMWSSRVAQR